MKRAILALAVTAAFAAPALAQSYPVSGKWGQSASTEEGAIDCGNRRVIDFKGDQRTDSKSGVPAYRNRSVTPEGSSSYRVVDVFTTGQISNAQMTYTLRLVDDDHIELDLQPGGLVKLQKCK
jgi:hypothetical protein